MPEIARSCAVQLVNSLETTHSRVVLNDGRRPGGGRRRWATRRCLVVIEIDGGSRRGRSPSRGTKAVSCSDGSGGAEFVAFRISHDPPVSRGSLVEFRDSGRPELFEAHHEFVETAGRAVDIDM